MGKNVHFFLISDEHGNYYRMVIKGNFDTAKEYLKTISQDVRYIQSDEDSEKYNCKRILPNGLTICYCNWVFQMKPSRRSLHKIVLPPDERHKEGRG